MLEGDSLVPEVFSGECGLGPYAGPWLTPGQYEMLCRYALSREYGMPLHWIKTGHLQGPSKATRHQIDLYWTSNDGVCDFLCIANAKFLTKKIVTLTELMTLLGVKQAVQAQKAMIITTTGYSEACVVQAKENGVALLVVRPAVDFDPGVLPAAGEVPAAELEKVFSRRITPAYRVNVVHRGFEVYGTGGSGAAAPPPLPGSSVGHTPGVPVGEVAVPRVQPARPVSIPNKMISSSSPAMRGSGPFGIRRK